MEKKPLPSKSISFNNCRVSNAEKAALNKSSSLCVHVDCRLPPPPQRAFSNHKNNNDNGKQQVNGDIEEHQTTLNEISEEIDGLIEKLSSVEDVSNLPEIPTSVEKFAKMVQLEIEKYDAGDSPLKFGDDEEQDTRLVDAVSQLSKLSYVLTKFSSCGKVRQFLSLTTLVIQHAMTFMEEELRISLEDATNPSHISKSPKATDSEDQNQGEEEEGSYYSGISEERTANMRRVAALMISAGYETECCQVYSILRRNAFKEAMKQHGFEKISIDEVQKMEWEALEGHIGSWIKVVKFVA